MLIRKAFTLNNAHIVRNCYSDRCKFSLHAHTAVIETFIQGSKVDNAGMLMDFGVAKIVLKPFLELHRDAVMLWMHDSEQYKNFIKSKTDNWIELTFTPSAELLAAYFQFYFSTLINRIELKNNEDENIELVKTRYHETRSGWAEADQADVLDLLMEQKWPLTINSMGPAVVKKLKEIENNIGTNLFGETKIPIEAPIQQVVKPS